jgi:tetratricopeptide (TPR) repeat protein
MNAICRVRACPGPDPRRIRRPRPVLLLACALAVLLAPSLVRAEPIRWRDDYGSAMKEATAKGLPLLVNIGSTDCFWCKQLDARTFIDEEIRTILNTRFIPLKLDGNKHPKLTKDLKIEKYPTLIFAAPEGAVLGFREGFIEIPALKEQLVKVLAAAGIPDWMRRDFETATAAFDKKEYGRAVALFKGVVEDGKSRSIQVKGRQYLAAIEKQASEQTARAKELADKGQNDEAIAVLEAVDKTFPGTLASRQGSQIRLDLTSRGKTTGDRKRQATEMLAQARDDYKAQRFLCCLDRCEQLATDFGDLPEGRDADKLAAEIKENTEWAAKAADQLTDRLCVLYLAQADAWLKKGQPQQAIAHLDRLVKLYPGSRHAELARGKLSRLRGAPEMPGDKK